ncbi:MAG: YceI family protein [Deltaproteobacteria bacterium]|nr:YceI family protein [Deltaproteobacteria bacterium]
MKRNISAIIAIAALLVAFGALAGNVEWQYDAAHSRVGFSVRHLGISKVGGEFKSVKAKVVADVDTGRVASIEATVDVASINTGVEARDNHLRSPDFFDVARFPQLTVKADRIAWNGNRLSGTAQMTIKGVTRSVPFEGEYLGVQKANFGQGAQLRAGYSMTATINRKDFGLGFNAIVEGTAVVSDQVAITVDVELFRNLAK